MKISVVIAAYNEADNIGPLTDRLICTLDAFDDATWELIYVIEGTDATRAIAETYALKRREIRILYNPEPSGLATAFRKGFDAIASDTDVVVTMDADLNHQPEEIPRLVTALFSRNASIVVGSRKVEGSATEGTPLWKRTLSDTGNRYMRAFIGMPVADTTSGYRAYRYEAVREIAFSSRGFAFLPEILVRAHEAGHKIVEEPIQFIFRVAGKSKMRLIPTALSYTRLFCTRSLSFPTAMAALILLAAFIIRLLVAFPVHKYIADADGILAGLCGIRVLQGSHPVFFPGGYRLGAQSCYVTAGAFRLFGVSRESLALTGILFSSLFVFFMYLYLKEAFGSRLSIAGLLLVAIPPVQLLVNTYVAWAYGEILMYCATSLWLAVVLDRTKPRADWFFAFGLSAGLALWCSAQSLMISLPILLWLLLRRVLNSVSKIVLVISGVLVGSSPVWIFFARSGAQKVLGDAGLHSAKTLSQVLSNTSYLMFTQVLWLFVGQLRPLTVFSVAALTLYGGAVLVLCWFAVWPDSPIRKQPALLSQVMLLGLIILSCSGLYVFSAAGSVRGWAVRYILPLYLVVPGMASILCSMQKRKSLVLAAAGILFLLFINLRQYPFTTSSLRKSQQASLLADQQLIEWLRQNDIRAVLGGYWDVYDLNFDSKGAILGIPVEHGLDYLAVENNLSRRRLKWALIDHTPTHLFAWKHDLNSRGEIFPITPEHYIFVPETNPPGGSAANFLELARAADPN
ncbi:MAG: glycosyltransferase [Acidobacteriaceae bacterium]|nr:glycosyltransferase [Acidobacteriaceae bacterium]